MATETERLVYIIEVQDNATSAFKGISAGIGDMVDNAVKMFSKIGESAVEFVADSVRAFAKFEDSLSGARKTMNLTNEDTEGLGKKLRQLALDFKEGGLAAGVAQEDLAAIAEMAGQMNISFTENAQDFETFVKTVAMASGAFQLSAEQTAQSLGQIKNNFKLTMDELPALAGAIDIVGNASLANEAYIMQFMTGVGAMAEKAGMTTEQMIALGGVFGDMGVSTEVASTAMTQTFIMLRTELDKFAEVLGAGGISKSMLEMAVRSGDMSGALQLVAQGLSNIGQKDALAAEMALKDLGFEGKRVLIAFNALLAGQQKYVEYQGMIADPINNAKSILESYQASIDTMNQRFKQAGVIINDVRMTIGEKLANALEVVMEKYINPLLLKISEWIQKSPVAQAMLDAMAKAIEWVGQELGKAGDALLKWLNSVDTATTGDSIASWFKNLGDKIKELWESVKGIDWGNVWKEAIVIIKDLFNIIKSTSDILGKMADANQNAGASWAEVVRNVTDAWNILKETTQATGETIQKTIDGAIMAVEKLAEWVGGKLTSAFDAVTSKVEGVMQKLKDLWDMAVGHSVFPDMVEWADNTANSVSGISAQSEVLKTSLASVGGIVDESLRNTTRAFRDAQAALLYYNGLQMQQQQNQAIGGVSAGGGGITTNASESGANGLGAIIAPGTPAAQTYSLSINAGTVVADDYSVGEFAAIIRRVMLEATT